MTQHERDRLKEGVYHVVIDSELKDGSLTYGELVIPGESKEEIFLSTYVCHPSMANNELSGPAVATFIVKWLMSVPRKYTYRVVFIPETIGSLVYLSRHIDMMKKNIIAGFNLTCVGDDRAYSFMPSRKGDTLADRAALAVLTASHPDFITYSYLERGSDERQYCSPGVDLPVVSIMRSKYYEYPEYHTSKDDLSVVTPEGLAGSFETLRDTIELVEHNQRYKAVNYGEPQLGRRGLYPTLSLGGAVSPIMDFLAYADGENDLVAISKIIKVSPARIYPVVESLLKEGLIEKMEDRPNR